MKEKPATKKRRGKTKTSLSKVKPRRRKSAEGKVVKRAVREQRKVISPSISSQGKDLTVVKRHDESGSMSSSAGVQIQNEVDSAQRNSVDVERRPLVKLTKEEEVAMEVEFFREAKMQFLSPD